MNKSFLSLTILVVFALFSTAFVVQIAQAHSSRLAAPQDFDARALLGRSLTDKAVADFLSSNDCSSSGSVQLCQDSGMALWTSADNLVEAVYLYPVSVDGFAAFKGELPFHLEAGDTMETVQQKLGYPRFPNIPQAGWNPGLPSQGGTPDHIHYWAIYKGFGMTVIYNSPSPDDKGAVIHAILLNK